MMAATFLIMFGVVFGTIGTIIGAGGGFAIVPLLIMLYPNESPSVVTGISLAAVFFNAISGSVVYMVMNRVDYRSALVFLIASLPSVLLGVYVASHLGYSDFKMLFAVVLAVLAVYLFLWPKSHSVQANYFRGRLRSRRDIYCMNGAAYSYYVNEPLGIAFSVAVGFLSSLCGIGGGILHVPILVRVLGFPVHIATATSHFMLTIMSLAATIYHFYLGNLNGRWHIITYLSIGFVFGAQLGARLSPRLKDALIVRFLAVAIGVVALRLLLI